MTVARALSGQFGEPGEGGGVSDALLAVAARALNQWRRSFLNPVRVASTTVRRLILRRFPVPGHNRHIH